ncbi:MAG: hypothetical protein HYV68_01240 [Candidatus Taylorbacteria bacterium]|nr:hypothetical protein [Candidatus Taylorbacteria bacterium]
MRLFLVHWPNHREEYTDVVKELQKNGHKVVYWAYTWKGREEVKSWFPDVITHDHVDGQNALDPLGQPIKVPPASKELIDRMHKTEAIVLTMMNKHYEWMNVDERKRTYYTMLAYWDRVLVEQAPDVVVFMVPPHAIFDYVTYELARARGIKTLVFDGTLVAGRTLLMNDFRVGSQRLLGLIEQSKGKNFKADDIREPFRTYYELNSGAPKDLPPHYLTNYKNQFKVVKLLVLKSKVLWTSIKNGSLLSRSYGYLRKVFGENIKKEYSRLERPADLSKPFVYFPLNYQPECTTSPQGDIYVDLILAIETLSAALPRDWTIYVKEHPIEWAVRGLNYTAYRYPGYYQRISSIKNVRIIPLTTDTFSLTRNAKAVASVTGTAALEAVLRYKPSIIFGHPWYQNCPMLFRVDSVETCREALEKIKKGYSLTPSQVINFFKCLDDASVHCYFDTNEPVQSYLSVRESAQNAMNAILIEADRK